MDRRLNLAAAVEHGQKIAALVRFQVSMSSLNRKIALPISHLLPFRISRTAYILANQWWISFAQRFISTRDRQITLQSFTYLSDDSVNALRRLNCDDATVIR